MAVCDTVNKLRTRVGLSQEQFAELFGVSRQAVQKWESGVSLPGLEKLIKISKYFDISLDSLVLESDTRITEELSYNRELKPKYANIHDWESYSSNLLTSIGSRLKKGLIYRLGVMFLRRYQDFLKTRLRRNWVIFYLKL